MIALMVCMRFSASSNTMEAGDFKTSSVTSTLASTNFWTTCSPTSVSRLWKAGRQCMNLTLGLPVNSRALALT